MPISASWIALRRLTDLWKALFFAACGGAGGAAGALISEPLQSDAAAVARSSEDVIVHSGIWFGIIGAAIAAAILLGQSWYLRRGLRFEMSLVIGAAFGFVAGAVSGGMAQAIFAAGGGGEVRRAICWGIAGGLLGLSLSVRIPNLAWWRGLSGGFVGGLMGGIVFIVLFFSIGDETLGRLVGVFAIGFLIGLMIMLADALFREAWLEVAYGHKERRTVGLGAEPVTFGSDAAACTVYVAGVPARACGYRLDHGQIVCEDLVSGQIALVRPGESRPLGKMTVTVHAASSQLAGVSSADSYQAAPARAPSHQSAAGPDPSPTASPPSALSLWVSASQRVPLVLGKTLTFGDFPGLGTSGDDKNRKVAVVASNPADPSVLGLKNLSALTWEVNLPAGAIRNIEPGRTVKLSAGTRIAFGSVRCEIR